MLPTIIGLTKEAPIPKNKYIKKKKGTKCLRNLPSEQPTQNPSLKAFNNSDFKFDRT